MIKFPSKISHTGSSNRGHNLVICQFSKQRKSVIGKDFSQLQSSHRRSAKGTDDDNYDRGRNDRGPPQVHKNKHFPKPQFQLSYSLLFLIVGSSTVI